MSILLPQARLERGEFYSAGEEAIIDVPGLIVETSPSNECNHAKFFDQIIDIDVEYATLASTGARETPGNPYWITGQSMDDAVESAIECIEDHYYRHNVFRNIMSPTFTPGGIRTITRETGNYPEYAGQLPSELTFNIKGIDNNMVYWARTHMQHIRPMSMGVYFRNVNGDIMGLMVGTGTSNTPGAAAPSKYAFLPIPILSFRRAPTSLGGFENPDLMRFSILFPPNWDSPYQTGSMLDNYAAILQNLDSRLGRILYSVPCIVPRSMVDFYSSIINN